MIGQDMNESLIRQELDNCLLTQEEIKAYLSGATFEDPFPQWMVN